MPQNLEIAWCLNKYSRDLVGINTMISSMTGSYVGYSFAVPSNIARKIIEDIMEFGNVQENFIGVEGGELNAKASKIRHY
jgi:S1-C subfamily serine protease